MESIINPETDERSIDELRKLFEKIISERAKPRFVPKYPEREGDILSKPAEAHIAVVSGELEPEVWETVERKEKPKELFGDFDVVLVCDRSGSMEGEKALEQRRSTALILEALKEFSDELEERRKDLEYDLNVRTESWGFGGDAELGILKALSSELTEKERVAVYNALGNTPGDHTKDFLALEAIEKNIPEDDWKKIDKRKLLKVIIVLSDGDSDDAARVQKTLKSLRERGVVAVGVGMGSEASSISETYKPEGMLCDDVSRLPEVLSSLLKKYLDELRKERR